MTPSTEAIKYRAQLVKDNLRNCHSSTDVHLVSNMIQTAQSILDLTECDTSPETHRLLLEILSRLETQQLEFFKKKFQTNVS